MSEDGGERAIRGGDKRLLQRRGVPRPTVTQAQRRAFLDALAATCNVTYAAGAAGFCVSSAYAQRRRRADFAQAWDEALASGYDRLEQELLRVSLERLSYVPADPAAAPAVVRALDAAAPLASPAVTTADMTVALAIMARRDRNPPRRYGARSAVQHLSTPAETDAAIRKLLDSIKRRSAAAPAMLTDGREGAA